MRVHACSIQRDRSPWLLEWLEFHSLQGIQHFYLYLHHATDQDLALVRSLRDRYSITVYTVNAAVYQPQLRAYQHCLDHHGHEFDWCAFIDADEFLFDSQGQSIPTVMAQYQYQDLSALAVYWRVFGTSGHVHEPQGRITDTHPWRAALDHWINRHFKSVVRGHQGGSVRVSNCAHWFHTLGGTKDCLLRPIEQVHRSDEGHVLSPWQPDHHRLAINHYALQSVEYWLKVKQRQGSADQLGHELRTWAWFRDYDQNSEWDTSLAFMASRW